MAAVGNVPAPPQLPAVAQAVVLAPPFHEPAKPQATMRVEVTLVQPLALAVSVAVNEPATKPADGVNVASAGFAFCDHVPKAAPPLHVLLVPVKEAPVIVIAADAAVLLLIDEPAAAVGVAFTMIVPVAFTVPQAPVKGIV